MSRPIIEVSGLSKVYRLGEIGAFSLREELAGMWARLRHRPVATPPQEFWALRDVSFTLQPGEVVGVIGRNGAGKSTLLKVLSRITEPTSGRAVLRGRVASLLEVGTGFHPDLSGRDNIFLNGAILGMKRAEIRRKFDEIVAFAEIDQFIDTPVKRYSSGMYVRLAFAVAAHLEPEILIVDEVLAVGDSAFQQKCIGKMQRVAEKDGRTILFVSHNLTAVRSLCTRALYMKSGGLHLDGLTDVVAKAYLQAGDTAIWDQSWPTPAPGSVGRAWLSRVKIIPEQTDDLSHVPISSPLRIEIDLCVAAPGTSLNLSLVLNTADDQCVFNSVSPVHTLPPGIHRMTCHVPGSLLNNETYVLRLLIVDENSRAIADHDRVLNFTLQEPARSGGWLGKWIGVVRPNLKWTRESLAQS